MCAVGAMCSKCLVLPFSSRSRMPRGTSRKSAYLIASPYIAEPHVAQRWRTIPSLELNWFKLSSPFTIFTFSLANPIQCEQVPPRRWQMVQWQMQLKVNGSVASTTHAPHKHVPFTVTSVISWPSRYLSTMLRSFLRDFWCWRFRLTPWERQARGEAGESEARMLDLWLKLPFWGSRN